MVGKMSVPTTPVCRQVGKLFGLLIVGVVLLLLLLLTVQVDGDGVIVLLHLAPEGCQEGIVAAALLEQVPHNRYIAIGSHVDLGSRHNSSSLSSQMCPLLRLPANVPCASQAGR